MNTQRASAQTLVRATAVVLMGLLLGACATYYPAGRDSGVYYEVPAYRTTRVAYVDPLAYPYWSLDYFYFSRYYHPYSVVVHRYDPWYYPYPGWYYGYRAGPRFAGHHGRFYYPWHRYGHHYAGYHPWRSGLDLSFGYYRHDHGRHRNRVRELDARLHELETRRSLAVRSQRPERHLTPGAAPWLPATGRSTAVRRSDRPITPRGGRGGSIGDRSSQRDALIQRLRSAGQDARGPERSERYRYRDRPPIAPPPTRDVRPRRSDNDPAPPSRQRTVPTTPPRSQPQRQPTREPVRPPRSEPRPRRDEPSRRERR